MSETVESTYGRLLSGDWKLPIWTSGMVCPICGSGDIVEWMHGWKFNVLECVKCHAQTPLAKTHDEALKLWNAMAKDAP